MNPLPEKNAKSLLRKLFILDAEGAYAAEYPVDDSCEVEFEEFITALDGSSLNDMQTMKLGEHHATLLQGETLCLVAISKGPLRSVELAWSKAILSAMEGYMTQNSEAVEQPEAVIPPEYSEMAKKLDEREKAVQLREKAATDAEERAWKVIEQEDETVEELKRLKQTLSVVEAKETEERARFEGEIGKLKMEIAEKDVASLDAISSMAVQDELDKLQMERNMLEKRAAELDAKEKDLQERESALTPTPPGKTTDRQEAGVLRNQLEAAKRSIPPFDVEAARRELDRKATVIQEKTNELQERENRLNRKESELQRIIELD